MCQTSGKHLNSVFSVSHVTTKLPRELSSSMFQESFCEGNPGNESETQQREEECEGNTKGTADRKRKEMATRSLTVYKIFPPMITFLVLIHSFASNKTKRDDISTAEHIDHKIWWVFTVKSLQIDTWSLILLRRLKILPLGSKTHTSSFFGNVFFTVVCFFF